MKGVLIIIIIVLSIGAFVFFWGNTANAPGPAMNDILAKNFSLRSVAFTENASIPSQYTCEGENTNPALSWSNVPEGTKSFALTMYDPDVPKEVRPEGFFDHWVLINIPADVTEIPANGFAGIPGMNGRGTLEYRGPCPPAEYEPSEHRYIFTLYALDTELALSEGVSRAEVEAAVEGHVLGKAMLMGRYKKMNP